MPVNGKTIALPGNVTLPEAELRFVHSRSSGPGGQNVNKVASRVTLLFDVSNCPALSERQRRRITRAFPGRINNAGLMRVVSTRFRTQAANRKAALERFTALLTEALTPKKTRRKTAIPAGARARRLTDKARLGERKRLRRGPGPDE